MTVKTDNNPDCPHCAISEAIMKWRESEGAKNFVATNREKQGENIAHIPDLAIMNIGVARAIGMILTDLQNEIDGNSLREFLVDEFTAAAMDTAQVYANGYARKGAH